MSVETQKNLIKETSEFPTLRMYNQIRVLREWFELNYNIRKFGQGVRMLYRKY